VDPDVIAPFVITMTLILSVAGVFILRPLTKRIGDLIEATAREKRVRPTNEEVDRLTEVVSRLTDRIETLEERQDFAERILVSLERPQQQTRARLGEPEEE
jgi:hypothetical protein